MMGLPVWTWPDWRTARPGTRFRHNRSGRTGTFIGPSKVRNNGAVVVWDDIPDMPFHSGGKANFVTIGYDATPLPEES
jgi:hypothetical protein